MDVQICLALCENPSFLKLFNNKRIARLIENRGIHIAHVYLDSFRPSGKLSDRSLLQFDGAGGFKIRDDADKMLMNLGRLQKSGKLWVTSMRELGNHLVDSTE